MPSTPDSDAARPKGQWPGWMDELLQFGPIAELESEWRAEIADRITTVLDSRVRLLETKEPTFRGSTIGGKCSNCGKRFVDHAIDLSCPNG